MAYIIGEDRNQVQLVAVSLDDLIDQNNPVCVIDAYVGSMDLVELGLRYMMESIKARHRTSGPICQSFITVLKLISWESD